MNQLLSRIGELSRFFRGDCGIRFFVLIVFHLAAGSMTSATADEWKQITAEELKMTGVPQAPGAAAVYLFSEVFTDDVMGQEHHYVRIKVLTDEGREQGNIEIPYVKGFWDLRDLKARMVRPDGSTADFSGTPVDKELERRRGLKYLAKVLVLSDVQAGSIVEYQYDIQWDNRFAFSVPWVVRGDLFTVRASFARRATRALTLRFYGARLPPGVNPQVGSDNVIRLELKNVPAAEWEDYMPPEAETRPRVDFYYYHGAPTGTDMDKVWGQTAKTAREGIDHYASKGHEVERMVSETVKPGEAPEIQLRNLYSKVQTLRNLTYEKEKTQQEEKREKLKQGDNVQEVIKHGYGWAQQLDLLFYALVRQAGFEAMPLALARRDGTSFFDPRSMTLSELPGRAVLVRVGSRDYFLEPGMPFLPFSWLRWGETGVKALRLDSANGGFLMTPEPTAPESAVDRKAILNLDEMGTLEGGVTITYSGLEAFNRRFDARDLDEVARRHMLETELQQWIPGKAEVELRKHPDWTSSAPTLTAEFYIRLTNWATVGERRTLCPEGIFSAGERGLFQSEKRTHDIYFHFPAEIRDDISVKVPDHLRVDALPPKAERNLGFLSFQTSAENESKMLRFSRRLAVGRTLIPVSVYGGVRALYQSLRAADESQAVLVREDATGGR